MELSCGFAPSTQAPDLVVAAEQLGYTRAWMYDSPALYPDVWVSLSRAADRTSTIGLGPGVLVPSLRHVMVTAAAALGLVDLAPGRVALGIGTGFTGRNVLGQRALPWAEVVAYVEALKGLLAGDVVTWDGAQIQLIHPDGFSASCPVDVPIVLSAMGPKGVDIAHRIADGVFSVGQPQSGFDWSAVLVYGTVLDEGEDAGGDHAVASAGPGAAVMYHALWEMGMPEALPGGQAWRERIDAFPADERHLRVHEQHLVGVNEWDRPVVDAETITALTLTGTAAELGPRLEDLVAQGATEIVFHPGGDDPARELERFAGVVRAGLAEPRPPSRTCVGGWDPARGTYARSEPLRSWSGPGSWVRVAFVAAWVGCGLATDGYSAVSDAISDLAAVGAPTRWAMTAGFVVFGIAVPLYAVSCRERLPSGSWIALVVTGLATLGVAAVPLGRGTDGWHGAFAGLGYAALALAPALGWAALRRQGSTIAARWSLVVAVAAAVCLLATVAGPAHGLFQRLGLTLGDAWIVASAIAILRSRRPSG